MAAGYIVNSSSDDDENETQGSSRSRPQQQQAIVSAQPSYHEVPFPEPYHHELEFAFKYFCQYAGHGHEDVSSFYTEEWVTRSSHQSGAHGRRAQREAAAARAQLSEDQSLPSSTPGRTSSSSNAGSPSDDISIRDIAWQLNVANQLQIRRDRIASKREALNLAISLKLGREIIQGLEKELYAMYLQDNFPDTRCDSASSQIDSEPVTQVQIVPSALFLQPLSNASGHAAAHSSPPLQRPCTRRSPQRDVSAHLNNFVEQDVPHDGNCGFHVMAIIHELHRQDSNPLETHITLRESICDLMSREAESIIVSKQWSPDLGQHFNIYIDAEMISERGNIKDYCDEMKKDKVHCGLHEFAAFVHMMGDDIKIQYHTTKVVRGSPEVLILARESVRSDAVTYHILHEDGADGKNGHFMYLMQRDSNANATNEVAD